jgi:ACS family tartrate transporter-like MFS transporter
MIKTQTILDSTDLSHETMRRVHRRLIPFLCLLFIVNYLDRTNVAMAKLQMLRDVGLTEAAYGLGAGLFFIGYFFFELPSNLILHRIGARRWIARIMITWGICSAAMMLTRSARTFYALRFLLGVAEAGFFPGVVLYLTHWIPAARRARTLALFFTSVAVSGAIGNPIAGGLMKLDGVASLHGWQWLFLLEGIPPVLLGIAILKANLLPDRPADAPWLTPPQQQWLEAELASDGNHERIHHVSELRHAADKRLLFLSLIYFLIVVGVYGFVYFLPTIIKTVTAASDAKVGLWAGVPYVFAAISMVAIATHADRCGQRRWHVASCALIGAVGLAAVAESSHSIATILWLIVAAVGIFGTLGPFWSIPTRYLRGSAAAGGIAVINCIGNLGGFVAPSIIGWAKNLTGSLTAGLLAAAASLAAASILVLCIPSSADAPSAPAI